MKTDYDKYFDPDNVKYSTGQAYFMALCSALAYKSPEEILAQTHRWGMDENAFRFFDRGDMQAFVAATPEAIIVSYRGTESLADLLTDAMVFKQVGPWGTGVHTGFHKGFKSLWESNTDERFSPPRNFVGIRDYILHLKSSTRFRSASLWVTGHSLGAALAVMHGAYASVLGMPVWGIHTFGCPRVGDASFEVAYQSLMKSVTYRHVRNNDPIVRVPLRSMGYAHVGQIKYFTEGGEGPYDDPSWWFRALDRAWGRIADIGVPGFDGMGDHSIEESYVEATRKAVQEVA